MLHPGQAEGLKVGWHKSLRGLAVGAAVYNGAAWLVRRESHLGINAVAYALLVALETAHIRHHQEHLTGRPRV